MQQVELPTRVIVALYIAFVLVPVGLYAFSLTDSLSAYL